MHQSKQPDTSTIYFKLFVKSFRCRVYLLKSPACPFFLSVFHQLSTPLSNNCSKENNTTVGLEKQMNGASLRERTEVQ